MEFGSAQSARVRHALFLVLATAFDWVPNPYARARLLRLFGATVGDNVRVHSVRLVNLESGFRNLRIDTDAHVGTDCLIDLSDRVHIGSGAVLAPRVTLLTHQDAGRHHGSPVAEVIGTFHAATHVGAGAFVGASATLLSGVRIGHHAVVAAGAVVNDAVEPGTVVGGVPARPMRSLRSELAAQGVTFEGPGAHHDVGLNPPETAP